MNDSATDSSPVTSKLRTLRWVSMLLGLSNLSIFMIGSFLMVSVSPMCSSSDIFCVGFIALIACIRIICMLAVAKAQQATAATIVGNSMYADFPVDASESRIDRQRQYRRWLWWSRLGMLINTLQLFMALYLMYIVVKNLSRQGAGFTVCFLDKPVSLAICSYSHGLIPPAIRSLLHQGHEMKDAEWTKLITVSFFVLTWLVAIIQCLTGSDVLRWRAFYAARDTAWRAHYSEVFDYGIREVLCCLGRVKYLSVLEEDDVYSVATLLGDLVAYRATGTGHLELLAGLALSQSHKHSLALCNECIEVPGTRIEEATLFHQFAEAAYTGPLLDFGRNPVLFLFWWLYRQGVLTPWARKRRPILEGDNWWRGHAAAFLNYVDLPPGVLRRGRVCQKNREASYFVVALHDVRTVVIAIRGTETPEDLITDGLCRECYLSDDDLYGLINCDGLFSNTRETAASLFSHYGHSGIVETARELYMHVDGQREDGILTGVEMSTFESTGFLTSLMGSGCECDGYKLRIVGHSLGGSVASLLGLRLKRRYPSLHVYAYGPLPCIDTVTAEACSDFVTTIVHNDEFSSRLSVNSIIRLRAAAIRVLSDDSSANSALINKFARKILNLRKQLETGEKPEIIVPESTVSGRGIPCSSSALQTGQYCSGLPIYDGSSSECEIEQPLYDDNFNPNFSPAAASGDVEAQLGGVTGELKEMFLPGLVIHIIPWRMNNISEKWKCCAGDDREENWYRAFVSRRENFKDIIVSPGMFLDHLPWRCAHAMKAALEFSKSQAKHSID